MQNKENNTYAIQPTSDVKAGIFYALSPEMDAELGCIGHVRMDFGHHGKEFWHTWHPRGSEELNSSEFKEELGSVVDYLRESVLKDLPSMERYCREHGGEISGGWSQNYGYIVETENYRYCLRCNPIPGDYQAYLNCFDKRVQEMNQEPIVGRISFASGEKQAFRDAKAYLNVIKEELPYRNTTGFQFETLTDDPQVRKAVDDEIYNLYGEENPRAVEEYEPDMGMQMGGM